MFLCAMNYLQCLRSKTYNIVYDTIYQNLQYLKTYNIVGKAYDIIGFRLFVANSMYHIIYEIVGKNL